MTGKLRIIIAGMGRVGYYAARSLNGQGHELVVIEENEKRCGEINDEYIATVIQGDTTRPSVLRQASPEKADAIAALTNDTAANLAACMTAQKMNERIRTVMRVDTELGDEYRDIVDEVIFPERISARAAANSVVGADIRTLESDTGDIDILEVRVDEGAPAAGRRLDEVSFPKGTLVISDFNGSSIARPETCLEAGKRYVVAVEPDVKDEVINLLRG
ncbi:MAG: trk system potassium uptake protein TrkA [Methanobacteriota archaeon]|jgi:trk system potassium uptake protein TrkA|uniref:TrkA family potassium uptake protein n=1 Tax=Halorutilus salinus TaxID=2487751 RepID=A0A9Q4C576_9EURY|nr:TrkA family potassium uptake protein [Halorutilus salinus]MCX2819431.1 TrkA family potassium uptake protein [Halorutilus salinus]